MFRVNDDLSIYVTRGDIASITVTAANDGADYTFPAGSVVRLKVSERKGCDCVVLQKDFPVETDSQSVEITLTEKDTRIGGLISKPKDYWYEIELNPFDNPQTIIGYDEDGAKVFKLFPEGKDLEGEILPEDIPVIDSELDMTSQRPVENQAIARRFSVVASDISKNAENIKAHSENKTNPHNVTKAQIGLGNVPNVATNDQTPTYTQAGKLQELSNGEKLSTAFGKIAKAVKDLIAHLDNKENPHGVTNTQIGAAPGGYGLGDIAYNLQEVTDADTATENGWYLLGKEAANGVGCKAVMRVDAYSPSALIQTVYTAQYSNYYPLIQQRTCFNGTWGEWEWQNPPMLAGEEYRTTERWNGKAVYTKLVDLGTTVEQNNCTIPIETTISNLIRFVPNLDNKACSDWDVYGATNAGGMPNVGNAFYCLVQRISASAVDAYVVCGSLRTGKSLSMQIWYTVD